MKQFLLSYLIIGLLAITNTSQTQIKNESIQFPHDFKQKVFDHISNLTNIGVHSAGTIGEKLAAEYILNEMDKLGLEISFENFEFESFDITNTKLKINQNSVEVMQVCFNPYTGIFVFDDDFLLLESDNTTKADIEGEIVLASYPLENDKFFRLFFEKPKLILVISSANYQKIAKEHDRTLHCTIIGKNNKHFSQNVVGLIKVNPKCTDEIIISAHYDSYPGSVGADDNASGVGALIELANYFMQYEDGLSTNIKFVAFGAEEKGLLGSRAYLNSHKEDISKCKLLFNMDQIGGKNIFIETIGGVKGIPKKSGHTQFPEYMRNRSLEGIESNWRILAPEALHLFAVSNKPEWLSEIIINSTEELLIPVQFVGNTGSDQMTFAQAGIVTTAIGTSGNEVHSSLDVPAQINKQSLVDCSKIVIKVVTKTMDRSCPK